MAHRSPRIRRTVHNTQLTYNLSTRVHDVKTYPVLSPQGATILIYGHENGVTVVWRGGRRFRSAVATEKSPPPQPPTGGRPNGIIDDSIMIIDDDDNDDTGPAAAAAAAAEKPAAPTFEDRPEFEDDVDDDDAQHPEVVQTLDLAFGSAVLHIAVLPMPPCSAEDAAWAGADILKERMVFAVSRASSDISVITLPLTPPSPASKARPELRRDLMAGWARSGAWAETVTPLHGQAAPSHGIAMTVIRPRSSSTAGRIKDDAGDPLLPAPPQPRIAVASHTREASGTLRLWDVALEPRSGSDPAENRPATPTPPFQTEYLPSYPSTISFNPTHMSQLLCVFPHQGAARIYDYAVSPMVSVDPSTGPFPTQGSWLLSLYPPFARPSGIRKPILDAAWIARGRAILVLLADGMWGVWDLDGASPSAPALLGGRQQISGIRGAAITAFSASGYVEGTGALRGATVQSSSAASAANSSNLRGELAPMTPHTRRDTAASIAQGASPERLAAVRGGICVTPLPSAGGASSDESAALWLGGLEHVCVIPAVSRFWDAQIRKGAGGGVNLFSGAQPTRMVRLHDLSAGLLGERCRGVGTLVNSFDRRRRDGFGGGSGSGSGADGGGLPVDILIRGETRIVIVRDADETYGGPFRLGNNNNRRRGLRDRPTRPTSAAIIVGSQSEKKPYNLSVNRPGILRLARENNVFRDPAAAAPVVPEDGYHEQPPNDGPRAMAAAAVSSQRPALPPPPAPVMGLSFATTMDAAADSLEDVTRRDIEAEMLDIMDLDRALDDMEERRGSGRKRVLFEER